MKPANQLPDDRPLWDAMLGLLVAPTVLVAHERGLFSMLAEQPLGVADIRERAKFGQRATDALLGVLAGAQLIKKDGASYALTDLSRAYLLPTSPTYFGGFLALISSAYPMYSLESIRNVIANDAPTIAGSPDDDIFSLTSTQAQMAAAFTKAMHGMSVGPADVWPTLISLENVKTFVDIGGGSGVHTIAAAKKWPQLSGVVVDVAAVCQVAQEYVREANLTERVRCETVDMWSGQLPTGDVHFYGSVFHDWSLEDCAKLARRSFEALPKNGRILVHEMLLNDEKTGPLGVAAFGVSMLIGTKGRQYASAELTRVLNEAGFTSVSVKPTFGYWAVISGTKA